MADTIWYTHVNRNQIDANRKHPQQEPAPVVRFQKGKYGQPRYAHEVEIPGPSKVVSSPHEPILPCGARLVITSEVEPVVVR